MKNLINKEEKDRIDSICYLYNIKKYKINSDGSIDVVGDVILTRKALNDLPLNFNKVSGSFYCNGNALTSLKGCPVEVGGTFWGQSNNLVNLEWAPKLVGGDFFCSFNHLTSLEGSPAIIGADFCCHKNKLTSLVGGPVSVNGNFSCEYNQLSNLIGSPTMVGGGYHCEDNRITTTYCEDDIDLKGTLYYDPAYMSVEFNREIDEDDSNVIRKIFKYQRPFMIWNDDFTLNVENFNDLISEIKDGLE